MPQDSNPTTLDRLWCRVLPWSAVGPREQPVRLVVADDAMRLGIPVEGAAQLQRVVGEDTRGGRDVPFLDVRDRPAPSLDGAQEINEVRADRGRHVPLQILLGPILGKLVQI